MIRGRLALALGFSLAGTSSAAIAQPKLDDGGVAFVQCQATLNELQPPKPASTVTRTFRIDVKGQSISELAVSYWGDDWCRKPNYACTFGQNVYMVREINGTKGLISETFMISMDRKSGDFEMVYSIDVTNAQTLQTSTIQNSSERGSCRKISDPLADGRPTKF